MALVSWIWLASHALTLSGDGAADWLSTQITGKIPAVGRMGLGYYCDDAGRIVTETSIMRHADDHFTLITAAVAQWHDFDWLSKSLPDGLTLCRPHARLCHFDYLRAKVS